ncbi:MAG: DUF4278 domain-containing protein [Synechococcales cyanobacterium K44_A2020_017]|nr:DUF4278 domain-containing protein [Synechococcales cyanobacterium K32_A2020_035]MBF2095658.1 DUF4278 domain-containing protein [Synechococcales cyanobacterium K44_A2020_017]
MKLTYRGTTYNYTPPAVELGDSTSVGTYRGVDIRFRNPKKVFVQQTTLDLKYRNAAYTSTQPVMDAAIAPEIEATPVAQVMAAVAEPVKAAVLDVQDRARALMMGHHRTIKQRQQAMLTRLDAEVGVPVAEAAKYWNHVQGKVHPSFRASYDRSGAALS